MNQSKIRRNSYLVEKWFTLFNGKRNQATPRGAVTKIKRTFAHQATSRVRVESTGEQVCVCGREEKNEKIIC